MRIAETTESQNRKPDPALFPYGGVTSYASNVQYRAWGAVKAASFGDGSSETVPQFNSRLQPTQFRLTFTDPYQNYVRKMRDDYSYYDDGRLKQFTDLDDTTMVEYHYMSRAYSYDHSARVKSAGQATGTNILPPFSANYGYDPFNNMTSRSGRYGLQQEGPGDAATYTDNRRVQTGWSYDADGRVLTSADTNSSSSRTWSYDAAGEVASVAETAGSTTTTNTMAYDGDGEKVQEVLNGVATYYLKSSVLDDAIVEEINGSAQKNVGYVYTPEGQLLARQSGNQVTWKHTTPGGTGQYNTLANGSYSRVELDPMGANIGTSAPEPPDTGGGEGDLGGNHVGGIMDSRWANFFDVSGGCSSLGYTAACHGVTSPEGYLQAQERSFFGDSWFDLPGNNSERERGEAAYERMVSKAFAAYTERKNSQKKPKLKKAKRPPRHQTPEEKRKRDEKNQRELAKKGNSEDDQPKNTLTIEHFNAAQESWIRYEMRTILAAPCGHAYEAEHLNSPSSIISNRGVVIRHANDLSSRSAADLGLDPQTYREAQRKVNLGQAVPGFGVDGRLQMYLNNKAFAGPTWDGELGSLAEVLEHEFIHEGITEWPNPFWPPPLGHDLSGFPGYDRIMEGCR